LCARQKGDALPFANIIMMRGGVLFHSTITSVDIFLIIVAAMAVWPVSSQEAAKRCQKSGCRNEGADELPALIVAKSSSTKILPIIIWWMTAFFCLRLAAHYIRKLLPIVRGITSEIRTAVGHYYDTIGLLMSNNRSSSNGGSLLRRRKSRRRRQSSQTSNMSLGSLADLIDDSGRSGRGASLWYDNDSSSAGYSSAYSSHYNSEGDETTEDGMSTALESQQSEIGSSVLSSSEYYSTKRSTKMNHSIASSTSYSTYNYYSHNNDDDQSRGGESVVSKFLNYISESKPPADTRRRNGGGYDSTKRRPSLDYNNLRHINNINNDTESSSQRRRSKTIDEMEYPSYLSHQQFATTGDSNSQRKHSSNASETLLVGQSKPFSGGVKMRKASAAATKSQYHGDIESSGKTKSSMQHQTKKQQQQPQQQRIQHRDKEEDKKKKSTLQHHLSKFSSSTKDDDENYSTMLSTVDLRTRATRDTRATKDSRSFL